MNLEVPLISDSTFAKWTLAWAEQQERDKPFSFFRRDQALQVAVMLDHASASLLLSTLGASTVKIRFGLRRDEHGHEHFELLLFGVDAYGQRLTPYYNPNQAEYAAGANTAPPQGNLPAELARQWMQHWAEKGQADELDAAVFTTPYGFLQGYNYPVHEFMEALQPFADAPNVRIAFGLHRYLGLPTAPDDAQGRVVYTFGLLFNAVAAGQRVTDFEESYFDLTAPCPRTC
ncbi:hypothetical protein [Hymenobacter sp. B81]|uniref:hypothetical protein n=1 Tax=Hymenobacter sp. B81 TaxID=3344878 RepID=UPI0037DCFB07